MIKGRRNHSLVAMGNKLYVIGSLKEPFEMYDSTCKSFVLLKGTPKSIKLSHLYSVADAFLIGSKLVIPGNCLAKALCYDVEKHKWSVEEFTATKYTGLYGLTLAPKMMLF